MSLNEWKIYFFSVLVFANEFNFESIERMKLILRGNGGARFSEEISEEMVYMEMPSEFSRTLVNCEVTCCTL